MQDTIRIIYDTIAKHDTIYIKGTENIDLIYKVDTMYTNAWNRLLIIGGILAILVPVVIAWWQKQQLKISEEIVKKRISAIDKNIKELNIDRKRGRGEIAHAQGEFSRITLERNLQACIDYTKAAKYFIQGNNPINAQGSLNALKHCISKLIPSDKHELSHRIDIHKDLDWLFENSDGVLRQLVQEIRRILYPQR